MAKSVKLKDNYFIDSTGVVHEKGLLSTLLNSILTKINAEKTIQELTLSAVSVTTVSSYTLLKHTITEAGTYLITGYSPLNRYNQNSRELHLFMQKNGSNFWEYIDVMNGGWTVSVPISSLVQFEKGDVLSVIVENGGGKQWMHGIGKLQLLKL